MARQTVTPPAPAPAAPTPTITTTAIPIPTVVPTIKPSSGLSSSLPQGLLAFVDAAGTWVWQAGQVRQINKEPAKTLSWSPGGWLAYGFGSYAPEDNFRGLVIEDRLPTVISRYDPKTDTDRRLTKIDCCSYFIAGWTPDGRRMFLRHFSQGHGDRSRLVVLGEPHFRYTPGELILQTCLGSLVSSAPDNVNIVTFTKECNSAYVEANYKVTLFNLDNGDRREITNEIYQIQDLVWSPSGDTIAVVFQDAPGLSWVTLLSPHIVSPITPRDTVPGLLVLPATGYNPNRLPITYISYDIGVAWSPDGQYLAMAALPYKAPQEGTLYLSVRGEKGTWTTSALGPINAGTPLWSPDGSLIAAFVAHEGIYLYSVLEDQVQLLPLMAAALTDLSWVPLGDGLTGMVDDTLYWIPLDGAFPQPLLTRSGLRLTVWSPVIDTP